MSAYHRRHEERRRQQRIDRRTLSPIGYALIWGHPRLVRDEMLEIGSESYRNVLAKPFPHNNNQG